MKKRVFAVILTAVMAMSLSACGSSNGSSNGSSSSVDEFTLSDVTADKVSVGVYAKDEDTEDEYVYAMFAGPDGNDYACLIDFYDDSADVTCGTYTEADPETDEDGIEYKVYDVVDAYTEDEYSFGYSKIDDSTGYVMDTSYTGYKGTMISGEKVVEYLSKAQQILEADAAEDTEDVAFTAVPNEQ